MRVVSSATWTSGEPVSLAARANCATTSDFLLVSTADMSISLITRQAVTEEWPCRGIPVVFRNLLHPASDRVSDRNRNPPQNGTRIVAQALSAANPWLMYRIGHCTEPCQHSVHPL